MDTAAVNKTADVQAAYRNEAGKHVTEEKKSSKKECEKTEQTEQKSNEGVVYEKDTKDSTSVTYKVNKMSEEERTALVKQLKADQEARQNQLVEIVRKMLLEQANTQKNAADKAVTDKPAVDKTAADDSVWSIFADGNLTVDEAAKKKAQEEISENGYYGVEQTASRIFDFACALAGDDVEKMKNMQKAFEKGFKSAEGAWGKKLPDISYQTKDAVTKKFDDYYKSKETKTAEEPKQPEGQKADNSQLI